ncbi:MULTISPECIES: hypothetical protein [Nocardioides]|uniref:Uncharacterized protein n=1 Tax=Nocardioides vastitatis TaxID=2568655 RepID=A0ABW0ZGN1_9ACTN|nr:hypothetical protein [Nocardioides sp.]THJ09192.1 hypothetical protein E7Z54_03395 [Nocardioides sp.]
MTTTTAFRTVVWQTREGIAAAAARTPLSHDMSCGRCGHGLHVYLGCGDECACGPQAMPGVAA